MKITVEAYVNKGQYGKYITNSDKFTGLKENWGVRFVNCDEPNENEYCSLSGTLNLNPKKDDDSKVGSHTLAVFSWSKIVKEKKEESGKDWQVPKQYENVDMTPPFPSVNSDDLPF